MEVRGGSGGQRSGRHGDEEEDKGNNAGIDWDMV